MNYYNEFDPQAARWLENLIGGGLIPQGHVDSRSITEVDPDELKQYTQCHFFAGIAGWSYALQLANWPTDRPVWTGSCPCQPFSSAGKNKGKKDERHLWPVWFNLIRECHPTTIFGEQVATAIAHGWLDDVYHGLETEDYAVGSAILPASSIGSPHKRNRLWFVANRNSERLNGEPISIRQKQEKDTQINRRGEGSNGGYPKSVLLQGCKNRQGEIKHWGDSKFIQCPDGKQRLVEPSIRLLADGVPARVVKLRALGNAIVPQVAAEFIKAYLEVENGSGI